MTHDYWKHYFDDPEEPATTVDPERDARKLALALGLSLALVALLAIFTALAIGAWSS